jgi:hypothetical protein
MIGEITIGRRGFGFIITVVIVVTALIFGGYLGFNAGSGKDVSLATSGSSGGGEESEIISLACGDGPVTIEQVDGTMDCIKETEFTLIEASILTAGDDMPSLGEIYLEELELAFESEVSLNEGCPDSLEGWNGGCESWGAALFGDFVVTNNKCDTGDAKWTEAQVESATSDTDCDPHTEPLEGTTCELAGEINVDCKYIDIESDSTTPGLPVTASTEPMNIRVYCSGWWSSDIIGAVEIWCEDCGVVDEEGTGTTGGRGGVGGNRGGQ